MTTYFTHYYNSEWWTDDELHTSTHGKTTAELFLIAEQIRKNCEVVECQTSASGFTCTKYENKALGVRYWVKDTFCHISEIDEARTFRTEPMI